MANPKVPKRARKRGLLKVKASSAFYPIKDEGCGNQGKYKAEKNDLVNGITSRRSFNHSIHNGKAKDCKYNPEHSLVVAL
jgi:hypothetical protein